MSKVRGGKKGEREKEGMAGMRMKGMHPSRHEIITASFCENKERFKWGT